MKRGNQYPERASDQLALLLLDFGLVERVKIADWQLNAQHENQMAAAAHQGLQIRAGPKWYSQKPRQRDQPSGGDRLFTGWNLLGTDDWQLRRHPQILNYPQRQVRRSRLAAGLPRQSGALIRVLFAHPASAGPGLTMRDGGNILAYFGHSWNLEKRMQIVERIGPTRQKQVGHDQTVFLHNIIDRDTIDGEVSERVATKREVQDIQMDAMKRRRLR